MEVITKKFSLVNPAHAVSDDGVSIRGIDRYHIRYERGDRHCNVNCEAVVQTDLPAGSAVGVSKARLWTLKDGSTLEISDQERDEMREDFVSAWAVLGSPTYLI